MSDRRRNSRRETVTLVIILTVVPLAATYGIVEYQHWRAKRDSVIRSKLATPIGIGPDNPPSPENFAPGRAVPERPAITDPEIVTARRAETRVDDDEMVIGVVIDGKARAYPLNMMTEYKREVFNDQLAGTPIAATW